MTPTTPSLPPLPPLPAWQRHLPAGLPVARPNDPVDFRGQILQQFREELPAGRPPIFAGADLLQASFERADLQGADFRGAYLAQTNFAGADLARAKFDEAYFHQAHFVGVDTAAVAPRTRVRDGVTEAVPPPALPARNAGRASFRGTRFSQMSFEGLDLAGANFNGAEFSQTSFRDCDLRGADLRGSRHSLTDFTNAKLDNADLRGADLGSVRNLTRDQIAKARTDTLTRLPQY
jgi:uncharacterized protein YjbI with pentapeptide repeats